MPLRLAFIAVMMLFGTIGMIVRYIDFPSVVIAWARAFFGFAVILGYVLFYQRRHLDFEAIKANIKPLALVSVLLGTNWALFFETFNHTTIAIGTICYYTAPFFLMLAAPIVFKEKLTLFKLTCVCFAFLGIVFTSGVFDDELKPGIGIVFAVSAAVMYATVIGANKFLKNISAVDSTCVQLAGAALVFLPYVALTTDFAALDFSFKNVSLTLILAVVHTGFAYIVYFGCVRKLSAQDISLFSFLDPLVAVLLSIFVLAEPFTLWTLVGAIFILGATAAGEFFDQKHSG
ncbi:MAG TPA: EamA family transporter [Sutterella sp.]|nr:EamA family transporter [Sutterella sp.]